MDISLFLTSSLSAFSIGIGCGTCCSPAVSAFLSSYTLSHSKNTKQAVLGFIGFFGGKLMSVTALCLTASAVGGQFITDSGNIGNFPYRLVLQMTLAALGLGMSLKWWLDNKKANSHCAHCGSCGEKHRTSRYSLVLAGMLYGITPCPPLILTLGLCASLLLPAAGITGAVFAGASTIGPMFLLALLLGLLTKKIRKEIPSFLKWLRLASYIILAALPFLIFE